MADNECDEIELFWQRSIIIMKIQVCDANLLFLMKIHQFDNDSSSRWKFIKIQNEVKNSHMMKISHWYELS